MSPEIYVPPALAKPHVCIPEKKFYTKNTIWLCDTCDKYWLARRDGFSNLLFEELWQPISKRKVNKIIKKAGGKK